MKIIRSKDLEYVPASHEDPQDPSVFKKVLFKELDEGRVQMINWAKLPVGKSFKAHYHEDMDEIYVMMTGQSVIKVDKEEAFLENGDAVLIPAKSVHKLTNNSDKDAFYMVIGISRGINGKTIIVEN